MQPPTPWSTAFAAGADTDGTLAVGSAIVAQPPKMVPTGADVAAFLSTVADEGRRADASTICELMASVTGEPAMMWGSSIIGFGSYHYRYASGHEGDSPLAAFSPRKAQLVVYLVGGFADRYAKQLARLGPHKTGKSCLYIKRVSDIDLDVLRQLVDRSARVGRGVDRAGGTANPE